MHTIAATDANRSFSRLLREVAQGQHISITSRGVPVAVLSPVNEHLAQREAAKQRLLERLNQQRASAPASVPAVNWSRDDLYN